MSMNDEEKKAAPPEATSGEHKRKDFRLHFLVLDVNEAEAKGSFIGYATDLSEGGMFISTFEPRPVEEEFRISFRLPFEDTQVRCGCRVAWIRSHDPDSRAEPGMGVRFIDIDPEISKKIIIWLDGRKRAFSEEKV